MYPDPLFSLGFVDIDLYSIFFVLGIIACFVFTYFAMKRCGYSATASDVILVTGVFAILVGFGFAILFQSFYDFIANPDKGFQITGKMTFLGGLLGGVIAYLGIYFLYVYVINPRLKEKSFFKSDMNKGVWYLLRFVPISITLAHGFGRIGCFFAGCCYGVPTDAWFGIQFATTSTKVVPTQLFEAIFLFLISGIMFVLFFVFNFKYNMTVYLMGYGLWRFIIEFFRGDVHERGQFIPGLSPSQFWSILMFVGGIAFFFIYRKFDPLFNKEPELEQQKASPL